MAASPAALPLPRQRLRQVGSHPVPIPLREPVAPARRAKATAFIEGRHSQGPVTGRPKAVCIRLPIPRSHSVGRVRRPTPAASSRIGNREAHAAAVPRPYASPADPTARSNYAGTAANFNGCINYGHASPGLALIHATVPIPTPTPTRAPASARGPAGERNAMSL